MSPLSIFAIVYFEARNAAADIFADISSRSPLIRHVVVRRTRTCRLIDGCFAILIITHADAFR